MKRKVIKQGNGTLKITLPKQWTREVGLKGGDEIDVGEDGKNIVIGGKHGFASETTIKLSSKEIPEDKDKNPNRYTIRTIVINALRKGHNKVRILFDSPKALHIINSCLDEVLGYEIIEQSSKHCIIDCVVDLKYTDFIKHFIRFRHAVLNFSNLIYKNLMQNEDNKEEIESTFLMLEKNYNSFCRFLMYNCKTDTKEKIYLFTTAEHMYQGARNMFYCSQLYNEMNSKLSKSTLNYTKEVFDYVNRVIEFITTKDISKVSNLNIMKNTLTYHEINKIICSNSKENNILLQLSFIARRMWDAVGPYVGYII